MTKYSLITAGLVCAVFAVASCTTSYIGPYEYVGFKTQVNAKSISQYSLVDSKDKELTSTYDDEYTYDKDGRVLKHKQTYYFNGKKSKDKFTTFETEFKTVGSYVLPYRASINGVVYMELEYELLNTTAKGEVLEEISSRSFYRKSFNPITFQSYAEKFVINMRNDPVAFRADEKFIKELNNYYYGLGSINVLTLGFDNVVLKRYHVSSAKRSEGFEKSGISLNQRKSNVKHLASTYEYQWAVIGGKICQRQLIFTQSVDNYQQVFTADCEYTPAGQRKLETWKVKESESGKDSDEVVVYKQELAY